MGILPNMWRHLGSLPTGARQAKRDAVKVIPPLGAVDDALHRLLLRSAEMLSKYRVRLFLCDQARRQLDLFSCPYFPPAPQAVSGLALAGEGFAMGLSITG